MTMCSRTPDMIDVEEAILRVLQHTVPLATESLPLSAALLGRTLSESLFAASPVPPFPASIMDGFAVRAPLAPGVYRVHQREILAGDDAAAATLGESEVAYITTGAMLPNGADAVVKVEDTQRLGDEEVRINVHVERGVFVREIGSDIAQGEEVLSAGTVLGPTELGLLATTAHTQVSVYARPVVGVLSTGSELVDAHESAEGAQVRDCNRIALLAALREEGYDARDLGIVQDARDVLKALLLEVSAYCDVVITSGGVSMGAADFVKPALAEIGKIHFSKLNMKPGKPTTFASYTRKETSTRSRQTLFFGLPGNPVSCLVTKTLFVDPALKRLQGLAADRCLHAQLSVRLAETLSLDPERAEYHRVHLSLCADGAVEARSTGNQRSSRLLSMRSANGLLVLPRGPGEVRAGERVQALLVRPLGAPQAALSVHRKAATLDSPLYTNNKDTDNKNSATNSTVSVAGDAKAKDCCAKKQSEADSWRTIRTGLLTISDRASTGVYHDESGPEMARLLQTMSESADFPLTICVTNTALVPDDPKEIARVVQQWTDPASPQRVDFLLTSGGTGFGPRDNTPETIRPLLHREAPGIAQALLNEGLKFTPLAVLSRPVVGTRNATFIATLPGSVKAVRENITALKALLPRIFELIKTGDCHK